MRTFNITVRGTAGVLAKFGSISTSSAAAEADARARFGDIPCGITVKPSAEAAQ